MRLSQHVIYITKLWPLKRVNDVGSAWDPNKLHKAYTKIAVFALQFDTYMYLTIIAISDLDYAKTFQTQEFSKFSELYVRPRP